MVRHRIRFYHVLQRVPPFFAAVFSTRGLLSHEGRILIWGKFRRIMISFFPPLARYLQKKYGLAGGCSHCSASCKLLFQCPHWDDKSSRCSVYEDRPNICRFFPITPADLRDRNLVQKGTRCGFRFMNVNTNLEKSEKKNLSKNSPGFRPQT
jgi:hypothetical protein